jgi:hypothetical protein
MNNFTLNEQTTLQKYIHRRVACNHRENLYYGYHNHLCYTSKTAIETQDHIITCNSNIKRKEQKSMYIKELSGMMINTGTDDNLRRVIIECSKAMIYLH